MTLDMQTERGPGVQCSALRSPFVVLFDGPWRQRLSEGNVAAANASSNGSPSGLSTASALECPRCAPATIMAIHRPERSRATERPSDDQIASNLPVTGRDTIASDDATSFDNGGGAPESLIAAQSTFSASGAVEKTGQSRSGLFVPGAVR